MIIWLILTRPSLEDQPEAPPNDIVHIISSLQFAYQEPSLESIRAQHSEFESLYEELKLQIYAVVRLEAKIQKAEIQAKP